MGVAVRSTPVEARSAVGPAGTGDGIDAAASTEVAAGVGAGRGGASTTAGATGELAASSGGRDAFEGIVEAEDDANVSTGTSGTASRLHGAQDKCRTGTAPASGT